MANGLLKKNLFATTLLAGAAGGLWAGAAVAQETPDEEVSVIEEVAEEDEARQERVVVTGSRIQRSEFTSIKPVQVISGEVSRDIGLVDAASLLQESTAATGLQIDTTFNGFVLDNGPGASTIDLRGLGASRTLVLINGRRLGAAGVEGAPGVPDLNLIPSSLIDRIDVLLDGASSIYGSDAVAGVTNVILRKDFDGFEIEGSVTAPTHEGGGGGSQFVSANWGTSNDRGFIGFAGEWSKQDNLKLNDRPDVFGDCRTPLEITTAGEVRQQNIAAGNDIGVGLGPIDCNLAFGINRIWLDAQGSEFGQFGSLYYTPGSTNVGVPNYSESSLFGFEYVDPATGISSPNILDPFYQNSATPQQRIADVQAQVETFSAFTYGEFNFADDRNTSAYFEALYSNRQFIQQDETTVAFNIATPASNPFNPCGINGADCGQAFNDQLSAIFFGGAPTPAFFAADTGPRAIRNQARLNLRPEDAQNKAEVAQFRMVAGLRGDLQLEGLGLNNWTYDLSASYDRATGQSRTRALNDERLALSIATTIEDPSNPGNFICGLDGNGDGLPDQDGVPFQGNGFNNTPNCVPINVFSPTLYGLGGGNLASEAEYDYLISSRTFNTIVEQTIFQGIATGDLFTMPAGTVAGVVGFEYREDSLESLPDDVARLGQIVGFFSDRGATGSRDLMEVFGEIEVPLLAGQPLAEELTVNASGRWTEESTFGTGWTYSLSGAYRPTDYLTLRGSFGTSFRAPNLREQFTLGQSGFLNLSDPCIVPEAAISGLGVYDPSADLRDPLILANCTAAGVDPTSLGATTGAPSTEVFSFKGATLQEETSESLTAGIVFEQPFFDAFDLTTSVTYYDIEVEDTIIRQGAQAVINDCFVDQPSAQSGLCSLIRRSAATGFITELDTPFINQDAEIARGIDVGLLYEQELNIGAQEFSFGVDADVNYTIERTSITRAPGQQPVENRFEGTAYDPEWQGIVRAFADYGDFRLTWNTRWVGQQQAQFTDAFGNGETCLGVAAGDVDCRDVDFIDDYFLHSASVRYNQDTWTAIVGVTNVMDEQPALVDGGEIFAVPGTNVPFGQDFIGRSVFVNVRKSF
ncbi:MAG: TonB-dependent receptor [Hyphomonas sp.]|jgi:iron complex outermembrane recepter protein|nr:TonB-dependent receptor [Hyphomonas sp.]